MPVEQSQAFDQNSTRRVRRLREAGSGGRFDTIAWNTTSTCTAIACAGTSCAFIASALAACFGQNTRATPSFACRASHRQALRLPQITV